MTMISPFALCIIAITVLAALGLPIGHAMIVSSIFYLLLSGLDLGKVISITESGGPTPPTPLPSTRGAEMAAVPLEPGQQTVNFSVTVIFELT